MALTQVCKQCDVELPLESFNKHVNMASGFLTKCKTCTRANSRAMRAAKVEYYREFDRQRSSSPERRASAKKAYDRAMQLHPDRLRQQHRASYERRREAVSLKQKETRVTDRAKYYAREQVAYALKKGTVKKQPCIKCGDVKSHGHHEDYSKPLDVMWLCPLHHKERHKELEQAKGF